MLNGLRPTLLALAAAATCFADLPAQAQGPPEAPRPPYTSERLSPELMERLLAEPLELIQNGDAARAEIAFRLQLDAAVRQHGASSVPVGDLLVSFGIILFHEADEPALRLRGIDYLRSGVAVQAAVLGRDHREVGLGHSDIGNALMRLNPADPAPEADLAIEEAWRVRVAALGRNDVETASSLGTLARLRGLPSRTRGERARIDAAAALFRQAIADFGTRRVDPGLFGSITTGFDLARMYRANGLVREAADAVLEAQADYRANFAGDEQMCRRLVVHSLSIAGGLDAAGHRGEAARVRAGLGTDLPCHERDDGPMPMPDFVLPEDIPPGSRGQPR